MKVLFVAGYGPIVPDSKLDEGAAFYEEGLGIPFEREGEYRHTGELDGVKHFALWPLSQAAESCFGEPVWPQDLAVPQAWIEFDVDDVEKASEELVQSGHRLLVSNRLEPWGQRVTRLISPEGQLVGLTFTPWLRD